MKRGLSWLSILGGALLLFAMNGAQAATVTPFETSSFVIGEQVINAKFETPETGKYKATIVDQGVPGDFDTLLMAVLQGLSLQGTASGAGGAASFFFDAVAGQQFDVTIAAVTNGAGIGLFSSQVSLVPIPASVLLLGSALASLVVVGRRRVGRA